MRRRLALCASLCASLCAVLAACSTTPDHHGASRPDTKLAGLRSQAALQRCPTPAGTATGRSVLPAETLACLGGGPSVPLRRITGSPTVVNFWATWCAPCRGELPDLQRFAKAAAGRVRVIGVDTEETSPSAALSFLQDARVHFPSVYDPAGRVSHAMGLPGLPGTVLLRADGSVAAVEPKVLSYDALRGQVAARLGVRVGG
ncbi:MAG TPA: TlpA disulfide reductase family protein [Mycobacteriales bacterium]|jgi:thiol-disulfide isomerase/thioredoxin